MKSTIEDRVMKWAIVRVGICVSKCRRELEESKMLKTDVEHCQPNLSLEPR